MAVRQVSWGTAPHNQRALLAFLVQKQSANQVGSPCCHYPRPGKVGQNEAAENRNLPPRAPRGALESQPVVTGKTEQSSGQETGKDHKEL